MSETNQTTAEQSIREAVRAIEFARVGLAIAQEKLGTVQGRGMVEIFDSLTRYETYLRATNHKLALVTREVTQ